MTVFLPTLNQMAFLVLLIGIGYIIVKTKAVPGEGASILSKLENNVFIPGLVLGTFMENFTLERFGTAGKYLLVGLVVILITMPIAVFIARKCHKDEYIRKIYTYGLAFSNFGFMGNAVVAALFPDVFMEYLIFVLPFWTFIYVWGVPTLLIPIRDESKSKLAGLKNLINPMFISMIIGMIVGISNIPLPGFFTSAVSSLGSCMSPVAMLLTGMTVAKLDIRKTLADKSIYLVSAVRLLIIPIISIFILKLIPMEYGLKLCTVCSLAMPLGLNTIVVPSAYGKDTSVAAGMALVSHVASCITIPIIFMLFAMV
ncbi:MAG: AEC family transporter [Clostridia bacterium]|nr:AEC family transporter [Clostridia bacterium]